jgi:hypothetical protein
MTNGVVGLLYDAQMSAPDKSNSEHAEQPVHTSIYQFLKSSGIITRFLLAHFHGTKQHTLLTYMIIIFIAARVLLKAWQSCASFCNASVVEIVLEPI